MPARVGNRLVRYFSTSILLASAVEFIEYKRALHFAPHSVLLNSYLYDSYNALSDALIKTDFPIIADSNNYGELFNKNVSAFENIAIDLYVTAVDGNACELRNKEGFSNISLMTAELYNLPWIWYHCKVNDADVDVKLAYHSIIESSELNSAKTYYEVLKMIAPDAPNPDNYAKFESYQKIYESEITLANDKKVVAMISELTNSNVYVMFNYEGKLVSAYANKDALFITVLIVLYNSKRSKSLTKTNTISQYTAIELFKFIDNGVYPKICVNL